MSELPRTLDQYRLDVITALADSEPHSIDAYHTWRANKVLVDQHAGTEWEEEHCENYSLLDHPSTKGFWQHEAIEAGIPIYLHQNGITGALVAQNAARNASLAYSTFGGSLSIARKREIRDLLVTKTQAQILHSDSTVFQPLIDKFDDVKYTQIMGRNTLDILVLNNEGVFVAETPIMIFTDREKVFDATNKVRVKGLVLSDSSGDIFKIEIPATWKMVITFVGDSTHEVSNSEDGTYTMSVATWDANVAKVGNFQYAEFTFTKESE